MRLSDAFSCVGRAVSYHPKLAKPLGGANAVLFFEQIFFWMDKTDNPLGVFKTAAELETETGLSVQEQRTARAKLRERGILIETEKRIEHKIYYRIDLDKFNELVEAQHWGNQESTSAKCNSNIPEMQNQHSGVLPATAVLKNKRLLQENTAENINPLPTSVADENHDCANALVAADATTGGDLEFEFTDEPSIPKNRREFETNPRELGTNPRALGTNPRAKGTNPRALGNVPVQQVLQTYNDVLGNRLPKAQMLNDKRKRVIAQRWREMLNSQDPSGKVRFTDTASGLAWFGKFFAKVALNPHWMGENDRGWRADLDWILKPDNFVKILEWRPK